MPDVGGLVVRDLFFGREKPRALWRVLLFLGLSATVFWLLDLALGPLVEGADRLWQLGTTSLFGVAAMLSAALILMRRLESRPLGAMGMPLDSEAMTGFLKGVAVGGGFVVAIVVVATVMRWLAPVPDAGTGVEWLEHVGGVGLLFLAAAAAEELLFRGYPFQVMVEGMGPALAVFLSSGAFAAIHVFNPAVGTLAVVNIFLAGVLLATAYLRSRSLWVVIGLHWAWNWVMAAIFDLPVSGIWLDVPGYDTIPLGPELLTGGAFGPEGGLLVTLLSLPLIVWVLRTDWLRESPRMAARRPLVDARLT